MIRAEFTIYPFTEGERPPAYVEAAIRTLRERGMEVEVGLLGQSVAGEVDVVLDAMRDGLRAALDAGAAEIVVKVEVASP
jgi:uncharacterized protein YqgV (UPF0045/DUF77 family)